MSAAPERTDAAHGAACRIMIMAGGTGGHVYPALAVADWLRERRHEVVWLGTRRGIEARVVPAHGYPVEWVRVAGLRGKSLAAWLLAPVRLTRALIEALAAVRRRRPEVVLGMGGFASGPGGVAARLCGLPLVLHEQNAIAGLTNRLLARIATTVCEAFPGSFRRPRVAAHAIGNPVRADIAALPEPVERFTTRGGPTRLLVLGGSLGARSLNRALPAALGRLPETQRPEVQHQTGERWLEETREAYAQQGVTAQLDVFIENMAGAYGRADLVVCRAGALTIAELTAAGVGAVLVPYPHAVDDHQAHNGRALEQAGAAVMVRDDALEPTALAELLAGLLGDRERLLAMAERARALACPEATATLGQACLDAARRRRGGAS